jgi:hypothetical protein
MTRQTKVYISGPMTGLPGNNYPAFLAAADALRANGYEAVNPAELDSVGCNTWEEHMRVDIAAMMDCTAICILPGSDVSKGSMLERMIASKLGFDAGTVEDFINKPRKET